MKKQAINNFKKISDSNLWIALASFCFYQLSLLHLGLEIDLNPSSLFIFFSALFTYNLFQFIGQDKNGRKVDLFTKIVLVFSAIISFGSIWFIDYTSIVLFMLAGLLTFYYATPLFKIGKQGFSLRKFWFLKSITVALVWTITCSIVPLLEYNASEFNLYWFSLEKFLFILGITIPYDIKDLEDDKLQKGMTSFAMKFGVSKTILVANFILFLGLCISFYLFPMFRLASVIVYSLAIVVNLFTNENRSNYWFIFLVDGLIVLYFLVCFISSILLIS